MKLHAILLAILIPCTNTLCAAAPPTSDAASTRSAAPRTQATAPVAAAPAIVNAPPLLRSGVPALKEAHRLSQPLLMIDRIEHSATILKVNQPALNELKATTGTILIDSFALTPQRTISLEVERFRVTLPTTQFVVGGANGKSVPFAFDTESVILLRGRIAGDLNSQVYLALSEHGSNGMIGSGAGRFAVSSRLRGGSMLPAGEVAVFQALAAGPNPSPFCHLEDDHDHPVDVQIINNPVHSMRQVQLAIDTDYEFYQIFNDLNATAAYVVQLYGACSDIFIRDINTRVDLTFVRFWDTPTVPFASNLFDFRSYWNANMQSVQRDVAQMFSGRGDLPGGIAYLNALCGSIAYSFCGNAIGYFAGVEESSVYNYDLLVAAHELGHNFGTHHTDFYGLDICNQTQTPPQRGTLMSYCSQTISGGNAVMEMSFHKVTQNAMKSHTYNAPCVAFDCNQNGAPDNLDILFGLSEDGNGNGIPDECEDCNGNGVLDPTDINMGTSQDVNGNGIPDECEPDCNGNGIPDTWDIQTGFSIDLHGNNIPDECEADCDQNGVADYNQIMADMTLDKNRNVILDSCEDCDNDGVTDEVALDGAWNVWAASNGQNVIREYHAVTGVLMKPSAAGHVNGPSDLIIAPGRRVIVSNTSTNNVVEFDHAGNFVQELVAGGAGGLSAPAGMAISRTGTLLVASTANHQVNEYDIASGAFIGNFVSPGSGGLTQPLALTYGPDENLYVSSASNQVFKYDGLTGAFITIFVQSSDNGSIMLPRGLMFKPDGNLLVTSFANNSVREFHGVSGAYIKNWAIIGVAFQGPWCIRLAPNGNIFISANMVVDSHLTKADIHEFNVENGNWVRGYVQGLDAGLTSATGFDFLPGDMTDCNRNQIPDNCDIASGVSLDLNNNGIPDECEPPLCASDITGDGIVNANDLLAVINNWGAGVGHPADVTGDGVVNANDLLAVINAWGRCQ